MHEHVPETILYAQKSDDRRLNLMSSQFYIPISRNLCSESVVVGGWGEGGIKFWDLVEDSNAGGPSSITIRMEYLFAFQFWYCELCVENQWGGGRKHCFVNFCSFAGALIVYKWGVVGQLKLHPFPAVILSEAISMANSDMLY